MLFKTTLYIKYKQSEALITTGHLCILQSTLSILTPSYKWNIAIHSVYPDDGHGFFHL